MIAAANLTNRWPLQGDPTRLTAAAAVLRAGDVDRIFGTRFPGEYVLIAVARLLDSLAYKIHERVDVGHEVVSAATEIAEHVLAHVLAHVPTDGRPLDHVAGHSRPPAPTGHVAALSTHMQPAEENVR